jgi:hypothetical protein
MLAPVASFRSLSASTLLMVDLTKFTATPTLKAPTSPARPDFTRPMASPMSRELLSTTLTVRCRSFSKLATFAIKVNREGCQCHWFLSVCRL